MKMTFHKLAHAFPKLTGKTNFIIGLLFGIIVFGGGWWAVSWLGKNDVAVIPTNTNKVFRPGETYVLQNPHEQKAQTHMTAPDGTYALLIPIVVKSALSPDVPTFTHFETASGTRVPIQSHEVMQHIDFDDRAQWMRALTGTRQLQLIRCFVEHPKTARESFRAIHYTLDGASYAAPMSITIQAAQTASSVDTQLFTNAFGTFRPSNAQRDAISAFFDLEQINGSGAMEILFDTPVKNIAYYRYTKDETGNIDIEKNAAARIEYTPEEKVQYQVVVTRNPKFFSEARFRLTGNGPPLYTNTYIVQDDAFFNQSLLSLCSARFCR